MTPPPLVTVTTYALPIHCLWGAPFARRHYEAKVTKAEKRDGGQWFYHLHYTGWGKDYDEWVEQNGAPLPLAPLWYAFLRRKTTAVARRS